MTTSGSGLAPALSRAALALLTFVFCSGTALAQKTERVYLSGKGKDDAIPWKFMCTQGAKSGYWTRIPVPGCWESFGFGSAHYQKEPTNALAEKGHYQTTFPASGAWRNRRVFLVFEGVMTDAQVKVNGQPAGPEHQGAFYRFRYEITDKLRYGEQNELDVVVNKRSSNESVNRAERQGDYWLFGGIFRPVYLEIQPQAFIERVAIDARADGTFAMQVFTSGDLGSNCLAEARIHDARGRPAGPSMRVPVAPGVKLSQQVRAPRAWSAETPEIYSVTVALVRDGEVIHTTRETFGFRTVEVREGDGVYVNGRKVILKGANRHSFWPESGRTLSEQVHRLDIAAMKEMNFNAVRMSHYPPDKRFLDLCDELGLYVLDELAGWHWSYDTPTATRLVEQMVKRDVNHPCILFWDNGNEGGWNTDVDGEFAKWDPQGRRVLHPWNTFSGINTAHYLSFDKAKDAVAGKPNFRNHDYSEVKVTTNAPKALYMPTEFLHGLYDGGAGAGMEDYWNLMSASPYLAGGFVWALIDEGFRRDGKLDVYRNQGPDGILGPYREREGSFYTIKEIWSPIVVTWPERSGPGVQLDIQNHYSFIHSRQCRFTWELRKFRSWGERAVGHTVLNRRVFEVADVGPGSRGPVNLQLPDNWQQADALSVTAQDPGGRELWTWVWPLQSQPARRVGGRMRPTVADQSDAYELAAGELRITIDKKTGMLSGVQRGRQLFPLTKGPRAAVGESRLVSIEPRPETGALKAQFSGALKSVVWSLQPDGWLRCEYEYSAAGPQAYHGVLFDYPEASVKSKRWLGQGPYRVWKNRMRGTTLDVWENKYNNTITGWQDWIYPEFKGFFAGVRWMQWDTAEGQLTIRPGNAPFVQVLTPELPPKDLQMKTELQLPQAGLGLMDAIPPIGSKFSTAREHGPQGLPNEAKGIYSGSVEFYFGESGTLP